jgi:hypothetical protein
VVVLVIFRTGSPRGRLSADASLDGSKVHEGERVARLTTDSRRGVQAPWATGRQVDSALLGVRGCLK